MSSIPIFLSSDNNYAPFVATTIVSICHNTNSFIDFYVLDCGISIENKNLIETLKDKFNNFSIEFIQIDTNELMKDIENKNSVKHLTIATYNRFLIPQLKPEIEKAIYLDTDTVVLGGIQELWNENLNENAIGMVKNSAQSSLIEQVKTDMDLNSNYFNAGVLLLNLKKWRENKITEKLFYTEKKYRDKLKFADQDVFNKVFEQDCKILNPKFNVQHGANDVSIRHFIGVYKPWMTNFCMIGNKVQPLANFDEFWKYAQLTPYYEHLCQIYDKNINKNTLTKRMSIISAKMKLT